MITIPVSSTDLGGRALRLHLLELFLTTTDFPHQVLPLAQAAEAWITGNVGSDLEEESHDQSARRSWTEAEEREMERLVASGMPYAEIAQRLGRTVRGVNMRALATGISKRWPRSGGGKVMFTPYPLDAPWPPPEADVVHIDPSADITIPVASEVVIPVPSQPPADDVVAAALEADRPGPVQDSPPEKDERERMIDDHALRIGVTTAVDFGPDQPAVDVLRGAYNDVVKSNDPGRPWLVNGARRSTTQLWEQANRERRQRGQKPIKRGA